MELITLSKEGLKYVRRQTSVKVDVDFWRDNNGVVESLNGEQRKDTNKEIEKYLGKFEDFVLTTLSLQGNNALFIDKSQSERKEILSQFIGVNIFDKLYQKALMRIGIIQHLSENLRVMILRQN